MLCFEGDTGKVYGTAQVPDDVEVPEGKTLSVGEGTSLIVKDKTTLANKSTFSVATTGTVTNDGTFVSNIQNTGTTTNNGIIQGSVTGEGSITNNGGINQGSDSLQVTSTEALQNVIHESVGKTEAVVITLTADVTENLTIPVNANVVIDGDNQYEINGVITCETSTISTEVTHLTLQNLTLDGQSSTSMAVVSQNVGSGSPMTLPGVNCLNLTMSRCMVQNYKGKALYLTNMKERKIDGCTFQDNATGQAGTSGDNNYTIDLNLCGVERTEASITNSTFTGNCGNQAVINMAVRGGESDEGTDVPLNSTPGNASARAKSLTISGCTFRDTPTAANDGNIGTDSKNLQKMMELVRLLQTPQVTML